MHSAGSYDYELCMNVPEFQEPRNLYFAFTRWVYRERCVSFSS
jgi:hypothetical protein